MTTLLWIGSFNPAMADSSEIRYDGGARRDPLLPLLGPGAPVTTPVEAPAVAEDLKIEGIVFDPGGTGSLVLINGDFYKEGDRVENSNIISIFPDRVILQESDQQKSLWIREEIVTKPASAGTGESGHD